MVADQRLWQGLADAQAKTASTYRRIRQAGRHGETPREALRLISGTLHSLSLLFEDFADADDEAQLPCPEYTLLDELSAALDDLNLAWSSAAKPPKSTIQSISPPEIASQLRKIQLQLAPAVHARSWPALLILLSTTGPRKSLQKQDSGMTNEPGLDTLGIAPVECLKVLLDPKFGRKSDSCHSHLMKVAERDIMHPEYASCARLLPKVARSSYQSVEEQLQLLFHRNKSENLLQWLLEYARHEWPNQFNRKSGALSRLMSTASDASVSPLHIAAALGLPQLCAHLILLGKQHVNQHSSMGTPLYCALLGPAALLVRSDDPAQLLTDRRPSSWQESTLNVLLDAGASCTVTTAGPQRNEDFSLATMAFLTCQSLNAPQTMVRMLRSQLNLDRRFVQLFHGKDSMLKYWPPTLPHPTPLFMASVLPEILDLAVAQYGSYEDASLLATGVYHVINHFDLVGLYSDHGSRPLDIPDMVYADKVQKSIMGADIAVIGRLILDPRWDPNAMIEDHNTRRSKSSSDDNAESPKHRKAQTILHYAVETDMTDLTSLILNSGEDIDIHVRNDRDQTPLMLSESPEVLKLLLDRGGRTTDADEDGRNVWHIAAANYDIRLIKFLYEHDEHRDQNLKARMKNGRTPIADSIIYPLQLMKKYNSTESKDPVGAIHMLELCVPNVAYLQNPRLISLVVHWGSVELVRKLINFGADPFYMDEDGGNALHHLNISASEPLVRMLLDMPVKPVLTKDGLSPAETMFSFKSHPELSDYDPDRPFDHPPFNEPFEVAAYETLLTDDILDSRNSNGAGLWERFASVVLGTWAAKWPSGATGWTDGLHDAVRCLIKKGALLRYEEEKGECAIFPVLSGWLKTASKRKTDTKFLGTVMTTIMKASTEADGFGESAAAVQCLKRAIQLDHTELVVKLLELRVSVHAPHEGISALETACMPQSTCQPAMFEQLLEHADVSKLDDVNSLGVGLLYRFLDHKILHHEHKLSAILRKGCDPNAKTPGGAPMVVAYIEERRTDAALALLEAGADPAASSKTGADAALAAASQGNLRVLLKIKESCSGFDWGKTCTHDFHRMHDPGARVDPGARRKKDCNALHLAAASGSSDVIQFYLEVSDLDVESQTADGWRPIHFAAAACDDIDGSCVRVLLEHGADPTAELPSQGHWNPLSLATGTGSEAAKALLELGSETVSVPEGPL